MIFPSGRTAFGKLAAIFLMLTLVAGNSHAKSQVTLQKTGQGTDERLVLDNPYIKAVINPAQGGRVESLVHKRTGKDLVARPGPGIPWGLLADGLWQQNFWHSDWALAPYAVTPVVQSPTQVKVRLSRLGTQWNGVTISKEISLDAGRAAVDVRYEVTTSNSNPKARGDLWISNGLMPGGRIFFPSEQGILMRPRAVEPENWTHEATRGWTAALFDGDVGVAAVMDYSRLRALRSQHENVTTLEWILRKADLKPDSKFSTEATVAPIAGLKSVAGVCAAFAVTVETPAAAVGKMTAKVIVAPFQDNDVTFSFELTRLPDGKPVKVAIKPLALKTDKATTFDLQVNLPSEGSFVLSGAGTLGGKRVIQFEKLLVAGKPTAVYTMKPQEQRLAEFPDYPTWARYHPIDFNFNSTAVETPHRIWAKPYTGGRPRVLALVHKHQARQAVELAQRFDIDLTVPFLADSSYYALGDKYRSLHMQNIHDAAEAIVLDKKFDVIILSPNLLQATVANDPKKNPVVPVKVRDHVFKLVQEDGAGLILMQRGDAGPVLDDVVPLVKQSYDAASGPWTYRKGINHVLDALPYEAMPPTHEQNGMVPRDKAKAVPGPEGDQILMTCGKLNIPIIATTTWGKGRVAQLVWNQTLIPNVHTVRSRRLNEPPHYDYWEYWYAMMGRFIYWAAHMESGVELREVECADAAVKVTLDSKDGGPVTLRMTLRDEFGHVVGDAEQKANLKKSVDTVTIPIPVEAGGFYQFADINVQNEKGTLAFGAGALKRSGAQISGVKSDQAVYDTGAQAKLELNIAPAPPAGTQVQADVMDGSGRVAVRLTAVAADTVEMTAPLARVIGPMFNVHFTLRDQAGKILDQEYFVGRIRLPHDPIREKFLTFFWGGAGAEYSPDLLRAWFERYIDIGMNANMEGRGQYEYDRREMDYLNMPYSTGTAGMAAKGVTKAEMETKADEIGPFSSPKIWEQKRESTAKNAKALMDDNFFMYQMGDENRVNTKDVDFSKAGLALFRKWLQDTQYKDLAALNAEWKTQFASWDEVMPMTEEEIKKLGPSSGSYAAWADQLQFCNWAYAEMAKNAMSGYLEVDKTVRAGPSGTQQATVYSGQDYWLLMKAYNALSAYGGDQDNAQLSYQPDLLRYTWAGYCKPNPVLRTTMWQRLGTIDRGIAIFSAYSHIDPDFTLPECGRDMREILHEMIYGVGQLLAETKPVHSGVYFLQSSASLSGGFILGNQSISIDGRDALLNLMNDLALVHRTISYEQLRNGELDKMPARVLVLPYSVALSKAECDAIRRWVNAGGTVIADLDPGTMTEHCRLVEKGQLDDVFGIDRTGAKIKASTTTNQVWKVAGPGGASFPSTRVQVGIKGSAKPIWTATLDQETTPVLFGHTFGKGKAYYFGFDMFGAYDPLRTESQKPEANPGYQMYLDIVASIMKEAGITANLRPVLLDDQGQAKGWLNLVNLCPKESGNQRYFILTRDQGITKYATGDIPGAMLFERPAFLYDVIEGTEIGFGQRLDLSLNDNTVRVVAALPYRVSGVRVELPEKAAPGDDCKAKFVIETNGGAPELHVFRVDVIDPDGQGRRDYSQNVVARDGKAELNIPFGLNDKTGAWTIRVRDVATGVSEAKRIELVQK